jgi:hypothetical protein
LAGEKQQRTPLHSLTQTCYATRFNIPHDTDDLRVGGHPGLGGKSKYGASNGIFAWEINPRNRFTQNNNGSSSSAITFLEVTPRDKPCTQRPKK